jgi:hypothetical protein
LPFNGQLAAVAARSRPFNNSQWQSRERCLFPPDQAALCRCEGSARRLILVASSGTLEAQAPRAPPLSADSLAHAKSHLSQQAAADAAQITASQQCTATRAIQTDAAHPLTVLWPLLARDLAIKAWRNCERSKDCAHGLVAFPQCTAVGLPILGPVPLPRRICVTVCQPVTESVTSHHFRPFPAPRHDISANHI